MSTLTKPTPATSARSLIAVLAGAGIHPSTLLYPIEGTDAQASAELERIARHLENQGVTCTRDDSPAVLRLIVRGSGVQALICHCRGGGDLNVNAETGNS